MVAVVVPSPATSLVFWATALTSLAPMFSNGSGRSISLETITPSLVTLGPPNDLSMMTLRPVGPRVTPTALASFSAPAKSFLRASSVYNNCFAMCDYLQRRLTAKTPGAPREEERKRERNHQDTTLLGFSPLFSS